MALNIKLLAEQLKQYEEGARASDFAKLLWKPKEGPQTIRIVPYKYNPENPFIKLQFYYKLAGKTYLAPCTFGKRDPVMETVDALRASGSTEERELAKTLSPSLRIYVPIIVRGEEELGVRFWGFGVQVHKQLLKVASNVKYGDITSLTEGRDIEVEFHKESNKKGLDGKSFPETTILADPALTPAVDPSRKDLQEKLNDQVDILTIFPLKSYDELKSIVSKWLNPSTTDTNAPEAGLAATSSPAPSKSAPAKTAVSANDAELAEQFDQFFAKPKATAP